MHLVIVLPTIGFCSRERIMVKATLSTMLFFGLSASDISSIEAKTVIYCETTQILQTAQHQMIRKKNQSFRMALSNGVVEFGINEFTGGTNKFKISNYLETTNWQSNYNRFSISFLNGDFYFSSTFPQTSTAVSARCKTY